MQKGKSLLRLVTNIPAPNVLVGVCLYNKGRYVEFEPMGVVRVRRLQDGLARGLEGFLAGGATSRRLMPAWLALQPDVAAWREGA